jgi:hypothetical protein
MRKCVGSYSALVAVLYGVLVSALILLYPLIKYVYVYCLARVLAVWAGARPLVLVAAPRPLVGIE